MERPKLTLALEDLDVTTFTLQTGEGGSGTIRGNEDESLNPVTRPTACSFCWSMCLEETGCCQEDPPTFYC